MKKGLALVLCFVLSVCLFACETTAPEPRFDPEIACIKGPTGVGMAKLIQDGAYHFTIASSADEISGKIISGEIQIASVPTNLAAKLYNKTNGALQMLAVNTLGVLSVLENGTDVQSVEDLKGKTIYATGAGSNPEYILRYVLKQNGLEPDHDVTLRFLATNDELIAALISEKAEIAMVPEPAATTVLAKKSTLRRAFSLNEEWEKISDSKLMMGCVVALKSFTEANPELISAFLSEYEASIAYMRQDTDEAAALCEKYGIIASASLAKAAIPGCNLTFVSGEAMQDAIRGYFDVLYRADAASIGGKLPESDFYYGAK